MPKHLQKYLSKIKKPSSSSSNNQLSSSKNWILSGCKHPKTQSFAIARNQDNDGNNEDDNNNNNDAATLSDVDRFLYENFRTLYLRDDEDINKEKREEKEGGGGDQDHIKSPKGILFGSPRFIEPPSDLCGSHRFFVSPAMSGSLIEEARISLTISTSEDIGGSTSTSTTNKTLNHESSTCSDNSKVVTLPDDCIAILTSSPTPYDDFRRSMDEMVEARLQHHANVDWDFMEELLFCYLNLNDKKSYKFILRAFVDLVVELRQNSNRTQPRSRNFRVARESRRRRMRHVT
ncbi:hypothetical protein ACOSQ3_020888 [Xanthoceras sorbifolium]